MLYDVLCAAFFSSSFLFSIYSTFFFPDSMKCMLVIRNIVCIYLAMERKNKEELMQIHAHTERETVREREREPKNKTAYDRTV